MLRPPGKPPRGRDKPARGKRGTSAAPGLNAPTKPEPQGGETTGLDRGCRLRRGIPTAHCEGMIPDEVRQLIRMALAEDVGAGDITARSFVPEGKQARG